jgi:hypothetical protein
MAINCLDQAQVMQVMDEVVKVPNSLIVCC